MNGLVPERRLGHAGCLASDAFDLGEPDPLAERYSCMIGHRTWVIPEGYIPGRSVSTAADLISHETACILNASDAKAAIEITLYFESREPVGPFKLTVEPRRTRHLRFNDLEDPESVPRDTAYSSVIRSDVPIVVQHTRLDSRNPNIALLSTIAFPVHP